MSRLARIGLLGVLLLGPWLPGAGRAAGAAGLLAVGETVVVATTEGDLLSLRTGPGVGFPAVTAFGAGTALEIIDGPATSDDGRVWFQVVAGGLVGWCAAEWLAPPVAASGTRFISGTDGGVRLRDEPGLGGGIILLIPEGGAVALLGATQVGDGIEWSLAQYGGAVGWVASAFLDGTGASSAAASAPAPVAAAPAGPVIGGNAQVIGTEGLPLRIRDGIGLNAPIFATIQAGGVIVVVNGPRADDTGSLWYGIDFDGVQGWVAGEHLAPTSEAASRRSGGGLVAAVSDPVRGQALVDEALRHLATPYVWGGDGPAGWDCSGMIQWLYETVAGIVLPRVSQDQFLVGAPLRADEIEAGDIVFFLDTDGPGITHNGLALGNGQFIHARSMVLGTTISWLDDPYWAAHFAGARRP